MSSVAPSQTIESSKSVSVLHWFWFMSRELWPRFGVRLDSQVRRQHIHWDIDALLFSVCKSLLALALWITRYFILTFVMRATRST